MKIPPISWTLIENKMYFLLFAIALIILAYQLWRYNYLIHLLGKSVDGHRFLRNVSLPKIIIKSIFFAVGFLLLFIVLLGPAWNEKEQTVIQEGRDLFIALDISRSMLAQDVKPSRLEFAKTEIQTLIRALPTERVGLILFSGTSFIQCPLTRDKAAFLLFLDQIDKETISSGTTAVDKAIAQAIEAFKQVGTQKNKLLIIFTDGEDFSTHLPALKNEAREQGLTLFTIGVGTQEGAPIPLYDNTGKQSGHLKDKNGTVVISQVNNQMLQTLAYDVGGFYIHTMNNHNDLTTLTNQIKKLEKEKMEEKKFCQREMQYPIFLIISLVFLALEWLL